jgi:hypothetical protein
MIRQARNYLLGALSGAGLIAAAVVAFVLLVSVQVFQDWPIADLVGGGDKEAAVSVAEPVTAGTNVGPGVAGQAGAGKAGAGGGGAGGPADEGVAGTGGPGTPAGEGGGATGGGGGGGSTPAQSPGGSSGGSTGTASSGGGGGETGGGGTTTSSTSAKVTGTVDETVNQVDETVTGGTLGDIGATQVTEEAVNGVAGPESTVGKVVDETTRTVEGVLGDK